MVNQFPVLNIEGIRVVPFQRQHLTSRYISWLNDPEVVQFSEQRHYSHTMASCEQYFNSMQQGSGHFLAIETLIDDLGHIGNIGVSIDPHNQIADMSVMIGEKQAWGRGFASIAWIGVMTEMLKNQGIRKLTAGTMSVNEPMLRLMKRSGMHIEAVRPKHFLWENKEVDMVQAAIFSNSISK
nr:GNAT family N-acetyltransferase [Legionella maioricensis]